MPRAPNTNRCKATLDTSAYYSKKLLSTFWDPYIINILAFLFLFCPICICAIIFFPIYLIACKVIINSWTFCLKQHRLVLISNYRLKGIRGVILDSTLIYGLQSFMIIFLSIDLLLFPKITSIKVKSPVFITGCARSGTTFTHRILTTPAPNKRISSNLIADSPFVIHALWEILCPSLTLKYALSPIVHIIDKIIPYFYGSDVLRGAYDLKLNSEAAEEGLFAMHCMAGDFWVEFLAVGFWPDLSTKYIGIGVKRHWRNTHVVLLKALLQRQIYWTGKTQIVAKSPSLCWFLPDILYAFPDCKILLLVRDPYEMICSNLSLFDETWSTIYGNKYMANRYMAAYKALIWRRSEQSNRYLKVLNDGNNKNRNILVVRYDDIKNNLLRCFEKCMEHCGLKACPETRKWIKEKENKQMSRKRRHKIRTIASYGLDPRQTKQNFMQVIKRWNFQTEWK